VRKYGKEDDDGGDFRVKSRSYETHESSTDPDSRLFRIGKMVSELRFLGHTVMESRKRLIINGMVTRADGHGGVADASQDNPEGEMISGADKGYDAPK
jgi:hypothetical protein